MSRGWATWFLLVGSLMKLSAACEAKEVPSVYPRLDPSDSSSLLLVTTTRAGAYLPGFPECSKPDVLCMDPPPFWMETKVLSVVHGELEERDIAVASTSHYGMPEESDHATAYLMRVDTDGQQYVMPRYERALLYKGRDGDYYLPVLPSPVSWLPCSVQEIRQEVPGLKGTRRAVIPKAWMESRGVNEHPELFKMTLGGAKPRYWVAMSKLREHLARMPKDTPLACEKPAGSTTG